MNNYNAIIDEINDINAGIREIEILAEIIKSLTPHTDDEGKVSLDLINVYVLKKIYELQTKKVKSDNKVFKQLEKIIKQHKLTKNGS